MSLTRPIGHKSGRPVPIEIRPQSVLAAPLSQQAFRTIVLSERWLTLHRSIRLAPSLWLHEYQTNGLHPTFADKERQIIDITGQDSITGQTQQRQCRMIDIGSVSSGEQQTGLLG
jgi:hypothetical protein